MALSPCFSRSHTHINIVKPSLLQGCKQSGITIGAMGGLSVGAARPGSHRWFSLEGIYHRGHFDLQGPAVLVKPEKNKPSGRYGFFLVCEHSDKEESGWRYSQI